MNCPLCDALANEQDRIAYQDDLVFVVVNIEPIKYGHVMVLPIRHVASWDALTANESHAIFTTVDLCINALNKITPEPAISLINSGSHSSQEHIHMHVLPSKKPLRGLFAASEGLAERKRADLETLKKIAVELKTRL